MSEKFRPVTAITMGDPAGIGPEIVVGTMLSEEIHECCKPSKLWIMLSHRQMSDAS